MTSLIFRRAIASPRFSVLAPYVALLAGMLILSTGTSFAKQLFPHVGAAGTSAYRVGFSALLLLLVWRPWRVRYRAIDWAALAKFGLAIGMMNLCFYLSLRTIPLGIALAIEFLGPLGVALYGARRPRDFAWLGLTLFGLLLLLPLDGDVERLDPVGMALAAGAALFWALYIVFGRQTAHLHAGHSVAIGMAVAALVVVPAGIASAGAALLDPRLILLGLVVALVSSAIPYSLEMIALKRMPARVFGTMLSIEPAFGAMAGFLWLSEALSGRQMLAIGCVILASAGTVLTAPRSRVATADAMPPTPFRTRADTE